MWPSPHHWQFHFKSIAKSHLNSGALYTSAPLGWLNRSANDATFFYTWPIKAGRGQFKIYIGMSAGVGKSFRMLQEAHAMLRKGINVQVGYIETHGRKETSNT